MDVDTVELVYTADLEVRCGDCKQQFLFRGVPQRLPCDLGAATDPGNLALLDLDESGALGLGDAVFLLRFIYRDGAQPPAGLDCQPLGLCANSCFR